MPPTVISRRRAGAQPVQPAQPVLLQAQPVQQVGQSLQGNVQRDSLLAGNPLLLGAQRVNAGRPDNVVNMSGTALVEYFASQVASDEHAEGYEDARARFDAGDVIADAYHKVTEKNLSENDKKKRQKERAERRDTQTKAKTALEEQSARIEQDKQDMRENRADFDGLFRAGRSIVAAIEEGDNDDVKAEKQRIIDLSADCKKYIADGARFIDYSDINVMKYSDKELIKEYPKLIHDLNYIEDVCKYLTNPRYADYMPYHGDALKDLTKKAISLGEQKIYLVAKMTIMSNTYSTLLKKDDTSKMSALELRIKADRVRRDNPELAKYLDACSTLKIYDLSKEPKYGIGVIHEGSLLKDKTYTDVRERKADGVVATKATRKLFGYKVKFDAEVHGGFASQEDKEIDAADEVSMLNSGVAEEEQYSKDQLDAIQKERNGEVDGKVWGNLGVSASVGFDGAVAEYSGEKSKTYYGGSKVSGSATVSLGAVHATGSVGANLFRGGEFKPQLIIAGDASASAIESTLAGNLSYGIKKLGRFGKDMLSLGGTVTGKFLSAFARGSAKLGSWVNKKGEKKTGFKTGGEVGVNLAEVKGGVSFGLLGLKVKLAATGAVGIGAKFGVKTTGMGGSVSIGAALGLGGGLKISLDWSGIAKYFRN